MMGVHVANSGNNKVYFVVDPRNQRETGAIIYPTGQSTYFNFWGWVSANPEIQKLEQNEFQELLWGTPLPQDEEMWEAVFFSRTMPLSGIIDQRLLENVGGLRTPTKASGDKQDLANQVMKAGSQNEQQ